MRIYIYLLCCLWASGMLNMAASYATTDMVVATASAKTAKTKAKDKVKDKAKDKDKDKDKASQTTAVNNAAKVTKPAMKLSPVMQAKVANYWQQARSKLDQGIAWNIDSVKPEQRISFVKGFDILVGINVDMDLQLDPVVQLIDPEDMAEFKFVPADYNLLSFSSKLLEVDISPDVFFLPQTDEETAGQDNKPTFKQQESMCQTKQWKVMEMTDDPSNMQYITICGQDQNTLQPKSFVAVMRFVLLKENSIFPRYRRAVLLYILMDKPFDIHQPKQLKAAEANAKQLLANLNNAIICSVKLQHNPAICKRYEALWKETASTSKTDVENGQILENDQ